MQKKGVITTRIVLFQPTKGFETPQPLNHVVSRFTLKPVEHNRDTIMKSVWRVTIGLPGALCDRIDENGAGALDDSGQVEGVQPLPTEGPPL